MKLFTQQLLQEYQKNDPILALINDDQSVASQFVSQQWLLDSPPKHMIFQNIYGDLLANTDKYDSILDVGGGITALTKHFLHNYSYSLLDIMAHDPHNYIREMEHKVKSFWINSDWFEFDLSSSYDLVIANDIFPNVDQRLDTFIARYLTHAGEMRISLTYYNKPRWYRVKRTDGDEIFHMMAWDGAQVARVLEKYSDHIVDADLDLLLDDPPSLFSNQRQVCMLKLKS